VAQSPHAVVAGKAVRAVRGDHEHRQVRERLGQRRQELERRLVGPVEVVEDEQHGAVGREVRERREDGLDERRAVGRRSRRAELGQDHRQMWRERAEPVERVRVGAQPRAKRGDKRAVGRGAGLHGRARQDQRVGLALGEPGDQPRLADAGVAADEQDAAGAAARAVERRAEPRELCVAPDQGSTLWHGRSLGTLRPVRGEVRHTHREIRQSHGWRGATAPVASPP
jgi:hypothetical protein